MPNATIPGFILCGGRSRRMGGGDKGLRDLASRPVLAHIVERFAPQVPQLAINANGDPARFARFGLPVVPDAADGYAGPLAGILAGLRWASARTPPARLIATVSCDTPFLPPDLVVRLMAAIAPGSDAIALAASGGRVHYVTGLWPVALASDLAVALEDGERAVMAWAHRHATVAVEFPLATISGRPVDPFFNLNTPDDLVTARRLLER